MTTNCQECSRQDCHTQPPKLRKPRLQGSWHCSVTPKESFHGGESSISYRLICSKICELTSPWLARLLAFVTLSTSSSVSAC